jgi:hypothetical protein
MWVVLQERAAAKSCCCSLPSVLSTSVAKHKHATTTTTTTTKTKTKTNDNDHHHHRRVEGVAVVCGSTTSDSQREQRGVEEDWLQVEGDEENGVVQQRMTKSNVNQAQAYALCVTALSKPPLL